MRKTHYNNWAYLYWIAAMFFVFALLSCGGASGPSSDSLIVVSTPTLEFGNDDEVASFSWQANLDACIQEGLLDRVFEQLFAQDTSEIKPGTPTKLAQVLEQPDTNNLSALCKDLLCWVVWLAANEINENGGYTLADVLMKQLIEYLEENYQSISPQDFDAIIIIHDYCGPSPSE